MGVLVLVPVLVPVPVLELVLVLEAALKAVPELEAVPVLEAALVPPPRETSLSLVVPKLLSEATKSINQSIDTIATKRTMEKQKNCILMIQATSVHNGPEKENNIID